ncbi:hypothetical protein [Aquimarina litoralis]|uniref:hypothetical protein n=1 Tax=Aquimarina litoralis TaxID=584605 RepID=UPI001C577B83|nr:hypothetical protein [Aquimarina litoralis]MBW1296377.1 hypothetical protein [Aquimarina litoralis]
MNKAELEHCHTCRPKKENSNPNQDWVQTDLNRYREMVNPILELKPVISEYLTIYPSLLTGKGNTSSKTIELLDDLKLISHDFYGGYTSFNLKLLTYNDLIIYSRLNTEVEENVFENIYLKEITIPLTCSGADMEYFKIHNKNLTKYKRKYPNFTLEIDINKYTTDELNAYYNLNEVEYNFDAYQVDDDYPHLANGFIKTLLEQQKYEVLEKLLFGTNPVGRIYSYSALNIAINDGYKPSNEIINQMEKVKENGLKFKSGFNSSHSETTDFDFTNKLNFN